MNIVVVTRCLNGQDYIERFLKGYDFASWIVVSEGGSSDNSLELWNASPKVEVVPFPVKEIVNGHEWNPDNVHIQHAIDEGLKYDPDMIILDDLDCTPNTLLRDNAEWILENCDRPQVNAFRLYLWGETRYFPKLNNNFDINWTSLWGWKPRELNIYTDMGEKHGTLKGLIDDPCQVHLPMCLLHRSWHPKTIRAKMKRYNDIGLPMNHPFTFAGKPVKLPEWAKD